MVPVLELFPEFAEELVALVEASSRPELAGQVATLCVVDRCRCKQANCAHFYTAARPAGAYPGSHSNVRLGAKRGLIVLDVVGTEVVAVEVLDRPDVKRRLDAAFP